MAAYMIIIIVVLTWGRLSGDSPWRFVWAIVPVFPALAVVRAVWRHVARIDDYQRALLLASLAGGFAVAMITAFTVGMLGTAGLAISAATAAWVVFSAGMAGWAVAGIFVGRR